MTQTHDPRGWSKVIHQTVSSSPFYTHLEACIQRDPEIFSLGAHIEQDQPIFILFGACVNFLVFEHPDCELAQFYPYLTAHPRPIEEKMYPVFRQFCLEHVEALRRILSGARLQTNSVGRCSYLIPALQRVYEAAGSRPLFFIEVGCSAGLNLNLDRYGYWYNDLFVTGDSTSPVQLHCTLGGTKPTVAIPPFVERVGIELFPLDLSNDRDVRWLRACIWPDQLQRYRDFDAALTLARHYPPHVLVGDASEQLPALLETVPTETTLCIVNSFSLNQGPAHVKKRIEQIVADFSQKRVVHRLSLEVQPPDRPWPWLEYAVYWGGMVFLPSQHLATCSLHGEQMTWHGGL